MTSTLTLDLFLSYHTQDREAVQKVRHLLAARGITSFIDCQDLTHGLPWREQLEAALAHVRGVVIFIGPHDLGRWQKKEIGRALDCQAQAERNGVVFPVIPVLLPGANPISGFLSRNHAIDCTGRPIDESTAEAIAQVLEIGPKQVAQWLSDVCPYRALEAFDEQHAGVFFGRDEIIEKLHTKVQSPRKLVAVVGPSGSGKSSLVQAGLFPRLRQERPPSSWEIVKMTPGKRPCHILVWKLKDLLGINEHEVEKLVQVLCSGQMDLADYFKRMRENTGDTDRVLLVVDHLEELFVLTALEDRRSFVDMLLSMAERSPSTVLFVLRADFYDHALRLGSELSSSLSDGILIPSMGKKQLQDVIVKPAFHVGLQFEAGLPERLLADVGDEPGNLPLLEFALTQMWLRRQQKSRMLTNKTYEEIGKVAGSIVTKAEQVFMSLNRQDRVLAFQDVFPRLVRVARPEEGGKDTRKRIPTRQFSHKAERLIETLVQQRLLVSSREWEGQDVPIDASQALDAEVVEIAHDALIQEWPRLRDSVKDQRNFLLWRQRLQDALSLWKRSEQRDALLLTGFHLREARRWASQRKDHLNNEERSFIKRSRVRQYFPALKWIAFGACILIIWSVLKYNSTSQKWFLQCNLPDFKTAHSGVCLADRILEEDLRKVIADIIASMGRDKTANGRQKVKTNASVGEIPDTNPYTTLWRLRGDVKGLARSASGKNKSDLIERAQNTLTHITNPEEKFWGYLMVAEMAEQVDDTKKEEVFKEPEKRINELSDPIDRDLAFLSLLKLRLHRTSKDLTYVGGRNIPDQISDSFHQVLALCMIVSASDDHQTVRLLDTAHQLADQKINPSRRHERIIAYQTIARTEMWLARTSSNPEFYTKSQQTALAIPDVDERIWALEEIMEALEYRRKEETQKVVQKAENIIAQEARQATTKVQVSSLYRTLAEAMAYLALTTRNPNYLKNAKDASQDILSASEKVYALTSIAEVAAQLKEANLVYQLIREMTEAINNVGDPYEQHLASRSIVRAKTKASLWLNSPDLLKDAEQIAELIKDPKEKYSAFRAIATEGAELAKSRDPALWKDVFDDAERAANRIQSGKEKIAALRALAKAAAKHEDWRRVRDIVDKLNDDNEKVTLVSEFIKPNENVMPTSDDQPATQQTDDASSSRAYLPEKIIVKDGAPMRLIAAGAFSMGSAGSSNEKPQHRVYVKDFYLDIYETTASRYQKFQLATGSERPPYWKTSEPLSDEIGRRPVVEVSWEDADKYCRWAGKRLPTEAEWEKAARGLDKRIYPWGDDSPRPEKPIASSDQKPPHGNFFREDRGDKWNDDPKGRLARVESFEAGRSPYGIYQMAGNVWEWASDWYDQSYYIDSPRENPPGPLTGDYKIMKGGSWDNGEDRLRASNRLFWIDPTSFKYYTVGFRCAKDTELLNSRAIN